jgi:hypothetical protein
MSRKFASIIACVALVLALIPAPQARAIRVVTYYTVWYTCICSPCPSPPFIVGEWTKDCDGQLTGWGTPPNGGQSCHYTETNYGDECE